MKTTRRSFIKGSIACLASLGFLKIPEIEEAKEIEEDQELYFDPRSIHIDTKQIKQFKERTLMLAKQHGSRLRKHYGHNGT